jgi:hypothetical protein
VVRNGSGTYVLGLLVISVMKMAICFCREKVVQPLIQVVIHLLSSKLPVINDGKILSMVVAYLKHTHLYLKV